MKHVHTVARYTMDSRLTGHDGHNTYLYGYVEVCVCGARRLSQYRSAEAAEAAHKNAVEDDSIAT